MYSTAAQTCYTGCFILGLSEKSNRNYYLISHTGGNPNRCNLTKIIRRPVFSYWISTAWVLYCTLCIYGWVVDKLYFMSASAVLD